MTIHIPEWLLWVGGTVAVLVVLFFGVVGLIASFTSWFLFRALRGPFWR